MIDLTGIDKAAVLASLYNASKQQGMGFLNAKGQSQMTIAEARELLRTQTYFDYLHGRVMKVDLSKDSLQEALYDRDNGHGAAKRAIEHLSEQRYRSDEYMRQSITPQTLTTNEIPMESFITRSEPEPAFSGGGGSSGGAGASGSWDSGSSDSSSSSSYDSGSSSSDSGSSSSSSD